MAATYHKLNKQDFIIQLSDILDANVGSVTVFPLEGELVYVTDTERFVFGDANYHFKPLQTLDMAVVHEGDVVTHEGEIVCN